MTDQQNSPDDLDARRRRARYRAEHRGTKELDLILGPFAAAHLARFEGDELDLFEALLDEEETDLQSVLVGMSAVPVGPFSNLIVQIRAFQLQRATGGARA